MWLSRFLQEFCCYHRPDFDHAYQRSGTNDQSPATGLIVIAIGCIEAFDGDGPIGGFSEADLTAYKTTLAVGVVATIFRVRWTLPRGNSG